MKLSELLNQESKSNSASAREFVEIIGRIEPHSDIKYFKLYPNPSSHMAYLLVPIAAVENEEAHTLSADELKEIGCAGKTMHRIRVRSGTKVQSVKVTLKDIGEAQTELPPEGTCDCSDLKPEASFTERPFQTRYWWNHRLMGARPGFAFRMDACSDCRNRARQRHLDERDCTWGDTTGGYGQC